MKLSRVTIIIILVALAISGCEPKRTVDVSYFRNAVHPENADLVITYQVKDDIELPQYLYAENINMVSNKEWKGLTSSSYLNDNLDFEYGNEKRFRFNKISVNKNIYELVIEEGLLQVDHWSMQGNCPFSEVKVESLLVDGTLWDMDFELPDSISGEFPCKLDLPSVNVQENSVENNSSNSSETKNGEIAVYRADYSKPDQKWIVTRRTNEFATCDDLIELNDQSSWDLTSKTFSSSFDAVQYYVLEYTDLNVAKSIADAYSEKDVLSFCPDLIGGGYVDQRSSQTSSSNVETPEDSGQLLIGDTPVESFSYCEEDIVISADEIKNLLVMKQDVLGIKKVEVQNTGKLFVIEAKVIGHKLNLVSTVYAVEKNAIQFGYELNGETQDFSEADANTFAENISNEIGDYIKGRFGQGATILDASNSSAGFHYRIQKICGDEDPLVSSSSSSFVCPGALPTRVKVGMTIRVTTSTKNEVPKLGIRPQPTLDSNKKFTLLSGEKMTVLDGPQCANDSYFWYINSAKGKGWVREGNTEFYFVDPLP